MRDIFHWCAVYEDGTQFHEYDNDGNPHGFGEVAIDRVREVVLIPQMNGMRTHALTIGQDSRPIFFRRRQIQLGGEGEEVGRATITCLGFQKTIAGHNIASYSFFFEDGSVLVTDDFQAV